ncbi:MAG: omptin family outer membrane protease [Treponema sp.]|nr:omptin family outer membrane protease [Treponema sp.]
MKNVSIVVLCIMVFLSVPLAGEELIRNYTVSMSPLFGLFYGQAGEILYDNSGQNKQLSRLDWDMEPLFYMGGRLALSPSRPLELWGLFFRLDMKFGVPGKTGTMEDRDWLALNHGNITNFSSHDNYTQKMIDLGLRGGASFPLLEKAALKIYGELLYTRFSFSARNGTGQYARKISEGIYEPSLSIHTSFAGDVINYIQSWFVFSPGLSLFYPFHRFFSAELDFAISPFAFSAAEDQHLKTSIESRDYMSWGLFLEPGASLYFTPLEKFFFSLDFSYRFITGVKGKSFEGILGTGNYVRTQNKAGAGLSRFDVSIGAGVRL